MQKSDCKTFNQICLVYDSSEQYPCEYVALKVRWSQTERGSFKDFITMLPGLMDKLYMTRNPGFISDDAKFRNMLIKKSNTCNFIQNSHIIMKYTTNKICIRQNSHDY